MRRALPIILLAAAVSAFAADELKKYEVWITGDVLLDKKDRLLFRADKAVQGNSTGNLVLLGATKQTINVLGPMYMKAAEKHMKLRLYGLLVPDPDAKIQNRRASSSSRGRSICPPIPTRCGPRTRARVRARLAIAEA